VVKKLITIGASDFPKNNTRKKADYTAAGLMKADSAFFTSRLALMPNLSAGTRHC
jgi:hypothetical protein